MDTEEILNNACMTKSTANGFIYVTILSQADRVTLDASDLMKLIDEIDRLNELKTIVDTIWKDNLTLEQARKDWNKRVLENNL